MADNVTFQSATLATPPAATVVSTEEVTTLNGGAVTAQQIQRILLALRIADGIAIDLPGDSSNGLDVDVTRSALPSGASTAANQTTMIGHLDGLESALALLLAEATFTARVGEVQASPTANTVLARLKTIGDALAGALTIGGTVTANLGTIGSAATAANQTTMIGHLDGVESALAALLAEATFTGRIGEVQASPTANTVLARLKTINDTLAAGIPLDAATLAALETINAAQSGTWTVQPGNTANTTPWLVKEQRASTATKTNVSASASSVTILAANTSRLGASVYNDSTAILYLDTTGGTASSTSHSLQIAPGGYFELPFNCTDDITGIWASANGAARVVEYT